MFKGPYLLQGQIHATESPLNMNQLMREDKLFGVLCLDKLPALEFNTASLSCSASLAIRSPGDKSRLGVRVGGSVPDSHVSAAVTSCAPAAHVAALDFIGGDRERDDARRAGLGDRACETDASRASHRGGRRR